jgi:branched-chain amino acid transport system permease protein
MAFWFSDLLQYSVSGLTLGSIYAMIALGFTLIFNATGIVNFAQGEFVTFGALIAISCQQAGMPLPLVLLTAAAGVMLLAAALEMATIRPARNASVITLIIITIGASILLRGVAMWLWGPDALPMDQFSGDMPIMLGTVSILPQHIWIMGIVIVTMLALWLLGEKTQIGKAMKACAINPSAARLVGISVARMVMLSFALSGLLGGVAGAIIAPLAMGQYNMGIMLGLKGFCAAILGGMGNPLGAVLGGLMLGTLESWAAGLSPSGWSGYKDAFAFAVLLAMLLIRPSGLLGRARE